jgi:hypothetical protein
MDGTRICVSWRERSRTEGDAGPGTDWEYRLKRSRQGLTAPIGSIGWRSPSPNDDFVQGMTKASVFRHGSFSSFQPDSPYLYPTLRRCTFP